jgi:hypothetical protein
MTSLLSQPGGYSFHLLAVIRIWIQRRFMLGKKEEPPCAEGASIKTER